MVKCRSKCHGSQARICNKIVSRGVDVLAYERRFSVAELVGLERSGPLFNSRLTRCHDRVRPKDPDSGVDDFLQTLRPYFGKGAQNVVFLIELELFTTGGWPKAILQPQQVGHLQIDHLLD